MGPLASDLRVLDGKAVVTDLDPNSSAEKAGVKRGWIVISANGKPLAPVVAKLKADPEIHELALERAVRSRITGSSGSTIKLVFLDAANHEVVRDLALGSERGQPARFGNLPTMHVYFESKKLATTGYVRFNMFLDLVRVMNSFGEAVEQCMKCDGLIVDLRGNPGGIGRHGDGHGRLAGR